MAWCLISLAKMASAPGIYCPLQIREREACPSAYKHLAPLESGTPTSVVAEAAGADLKIKPLL